MPIAVRIDDVVLNPDNTATFLYSFGTTPLPAGPMRIGRTFASREDFIEQMRQFRDTQLEEALFVIICAYWATRNPSLNNPSLLEGRMITLNLETGNLNQVVTIT